jgi:acyl-CoA thioesterase
MTGRFDTHTHVERNGDGSWRAELTDAWNIGPVPNGGYLISTMSRAAIAELDVPDLLNVTCYFVSPSSPGPATLRVEVIKRGRTSSLAQVSLVQDERERARALVLGGDLSMQHGPELHLVAPPDLPPPEQCSRVSPGTGSALMNELDLRLDPTTPFLRGALDGSASMSGWACFADGRPHDTISLAAFTDFLPPTTFNVFGPAAWVPTLELTVQIRRRPAAGWIRVRVQTRHVSAGHFEEDGELWDEDGKLVAISRQRALMLSHS